MDVAEIRGALLTAKEGRSLARLWEAFAPGDQVRLRLSRLTSGVAELPRVELVHWEQGPRGAFAPGAAVLLPVLDLDPEAGTAVLGAGELRLAHPVTGSELARMPLGTLMRLTPENVLEPAGRPCPCRESHPCSSGGMFVLVEDSDQTLVPRMSRRAIWSGPVIGGGSGRSGRGPRIGQHGVERLGELPVPIPGNRARHPAS